MPVPVIDILDSEDIDADLDRAGDMLRDGKLVVLPTETVYGVAGRIDRPETLARLRALRASNEKAPCARAHAGRLSRAHPAGAVYSRATLPDPADVARAGHGRSPMRVRTRRSPAYFSFAACRCRHCGSPHSGPRGPGFASALGR